LRPAGKSLILGFALATALVAACSSRHAPVAADPGSSVGDAAASDDGTATVGLRFTLPGGSHFSVITYTLANGAHTYGPTAVDVSASSDVSFVITDVAAGTGYSIALRGTSDDQSTGCSGSFGTGVSNAGQDNGAPFTIRPRQTTVINVQMICELFPFGPLPRATINGIPSCCATWDTLVANPDSNPPSPPLSTTAPGNTTYLTGHASGPCDGDAGAGGTLNCVWSVRNGFGTVSATTTDNRGGFFSTFTCSATPGTSTLQLYCTDGPLPDGGFCPASLTTGTVDVTCANAAPCSQAGESGVEAVPNTAGGACTGTDPATGNPLVNSGVADSQGNFCCVAACGGGPVATPFTPTGTCPGGRTNDGHGCCVSLHPCTVVGDPACVQCQFNDTPPNTNKTCTPTEARIVQYDIDKGRATAAGPDPVGSCYTCLAQNSCIDDTRLGDTNQECEDSSITTGTAAQCEAVIDCIFRTNTGMGTCAKSAAVGCYCGTAALTTACQGNPSSANGDCDVQIASGLGFPTLDGTDNTAHFTDAFRAAGVADQIFSCAHTNSCTACYN
jgi:hypothetical protein